MRVHRGAVSPIGGINVIRAGRKDQQTVHYGTHLHVISRPAARALVLNFAAVDHRRQHEQVPGARDKPQRNAVRLQGRYQVVDAAAMVAVTACVQVHLPAAGGDECVVTAGRGVGREGQNGSVAVGDELVTGFEDDALEHLAAMLHGQHLDGIRRNKGPGIHHLGAVGINNPQPPAGFEWNRQAMPGGNRNSISIRHPYNIVKQGKILRVRYE